MLGIRKPLRRSHARIAGARANPVMKREASAGRLPGARWAALGAVALAAFVAIATPVGANIVNRVLPPSTDAEPKAGGGFAVAVRVIPKCGQQYALADAINPQTEAAELDGFSSGGTDGRQAFLRDHRGAPLGTITVEAVFTGKSRLPTRILDVQIDRLETSTSLKGTSLRTSCQGDPPARSVEVNLDSPPRELMSQGRPYFAEKDLEVSLEERENLRIFLTANAKSYRWIFVVHYLDAAGRVTQGYVGTDGRIYDRSDAVPKDVEFSLSGPAASYDVTYEESGGRLYPVGN
jgi:hypothetical protein